MNKVDIHVHVSNEKGVEINGLPLISVDQLVKSMDDRGIDKSAIMSTSIENNDECKEIIKKYPDRFYYMCCVDIDSKDLENDLIKEKENGCIGIGELVINYPMNEFDELFSLAEKLKMPILFHVSTQLGKYYGVYDKCGLPYLEEVLIKYPNLIFIGHSQAFWFEMSENDGECSSEERNEYPKGSILKEGKVQEYLRKYPNLYCDLSANSGGNAIMRDREYGIKFLNEFKDRLIFGTDIFNIDQYFPLQNYLNELLENKEISQEVYDNIFYNNFNKLFNK